MRRILPIALALVAVTAAPANAAQCKKHKGETVVARSPAALVTRSGKTATDWAYRACSFSRGHRYLLLKQDADYPFSWNTFEEVKLAGPYAGLAYDAGEKDDAKIVLAVWDLRNGRSSGVIAGIDYTNGPRYTLERFVLSNHGAVAWRGTETDPFAGAIQRISIADSHGLRLLDSGPSGSLAGPSFPYPRTVAWSHDGSSYVASAYHGLPRY